MTCLTLLLLLATVSLAVPSTITVNELKRIATGIRSHTPVKELNDHIAEHIQDIKEKFAFLNEFNKLLPLHATPSLPVTPIPVNELKDYIATGSQEKAECLKEFNVLLFPLNTGDKFFNHLKGYLCNPDEKPNPDGKCVKAVEKAVKAVGNWNVKVEEMTEQLKLRLPKYAETLPGAVKDAWQRTTLETAIEQDKPRVVQDNLNFPFGRLSSEQLLDLAFESTVKTSYTHFQANFLENGVKARVVHNYLGYPFNGLSSKEFFDLAFESTVKTSYTHFGGKTYFKDEVLKFLMTKKNGDVDLFGKLSTIVDRFRPHTGHDNGRKYSAMVTSYGTELAYMQNNCVEGRNPVYPGNGSILWPLKEKLWGETN